MPAPLPGPYPRQWGASDLALIQSYFQRLWNHRFAVQTIEQAMLTEAEMRRFHPVCDWLDTLAWDGKPRLDFWLINAFACADTAYHRAAGAKFMIAAVRRVRHPGTKFDTLLVLEGAQGLGKSRCCKRLFGEKWFSDALPHDLASRDAALGLLGVWGVELGEIDQLVRTEVETVKAFLSRSTDRYRPPYGKVYIERPRQGVMVGTTNQDDYLRDTTGNRRFWPIHCDAADEDWIRVNLDQLWAEASAREAAGESIWIDDKDAQFTAKQAQSKRLVEDVWADAISDWLKGRFKTTTAEVIDDALKITKDRQDRKVQMRVAAILKMEGWVQKVGWANGKATRIWERPDPVLPIVDEEFPF